MSGRVFYYTDKEPQTIYWSKSTMDIYNKKYNRGDNIMFGSKVEREAKDVWVSGDGRETKIKDMGDQHLINTIAYLARRVKELTMVAHEDTDAHLDRDVLIKVGNKISGGKFSRLIKEAKKRKLV